MSAKQFKFGKDARQALFNGADILSRIVTTTLGPRGQNVALDRRWVSPVIIHDGVTAAKDVELPDPFENMGAQMVKEAAMKTNDKAGDGTTSSTLLAWSILQEGMKEIEAGHNPMLLKRGIDKATALVVEELERMKKPVETSEQIVQVATISSTYPTVGKIIAEAIEKVGRDGVLTVEEWSGLDIEVEYMEGMQFDRGYLSPQFVTDPDKEEAIVETPFVLLVAGRISSPSELAGAINKVLTMAKAKEFVIIADQIDEEVVATLALNKRGDRLHPIAIQSPGIADRRKQYLEDIAVLTGATVIGEATGLTLETTEFNHFGRCKRVVSDKNTTKIVGGLGSVENIKQRVDYIKTLVAKEESEFEKKKLQERISKLTGGAAVIKVGAQTELELNELKERVIDAVEATRSAIEEGIVVGGGIALFWAKEVLTGKFEDQPEAVKAGVKIVYSSLIYPLAKLLRNSELDDKKTEEIISSLKDLGEAYGYDVENGRVVDMFKAGIIDPKKVVRSSLQNAASVAGTMLTTDVLSTDVKREEPPASIQE